MGDDDTLELWFMEGARKSDRGNPNILLPCSLLLPSSFDSLSPVLTRGAFRLAKILVGNPETFSVKFIGTSKNARRAQEDSKIEMEILCKRNSNFRINRLERKKWSTSKDGSICIQRVKPTFWLNGKRLRVF